MAEVTRDAIARVGVDLSKRVFQVHAVDRSGRVVLAKALSPDQFFTWCLELPAGSLVAMEACGGTHHAARRLRLTGLHARLITGHFVTSYRMASKGGKNDANDAAAIWEAAGRPHMRFVAVKTAEQKGQLSVHRLREVRLPRQRAQRHGLGQVSLWGVAGATLALEEGLELQLLGLGLGVDVNDARLRLPGWGWWGREQE